MVKLSYYFPVSSDSISLKKQLLESGVLDITNETMYRMAPEAVDPSILSRGSLSHRRYTRSALLMLRDDTLSIKKPKCLIDSRLLKFSFWKLNSFKITDKLTTKTSISMYEENSLQTRFQNNKNSSNNDKSKGNHNIASTTFVKNPTKQCSNEIDKNIVNKEDRIQFRYDSREGRFIEKNDAKINNLSTIANKNENIKPTQQWDSYLTELRNLEHKNFQSCIMPNFIKHKYEHNSKEMLDYNRNDRNEDEILVINSQRKPKQNCNKDNNKDDILSQKPIIDNARRIEIQRYGSGRISFQNKNSNYLGKNYFDMNLSNNSVKYGDIRRNNNKYTSNHYHYNNYNNQNNHHHYHNRYRKDSGSSSAHSFNSEEPEWLSCGPTSQNDVIELRGFDDDPASDGENKNSNASEKKNNRYLNQINKKESISDESKEKILNSKKITLSACKNDAVRNKIPSQISTSSVIPNASMTSGINDEIQSGCTNIQSPPPARSTPTKVLNFDVNSNNQNHVHSKNSTIDNTKKNYYSLQFNFDNFLNYDTLNNILEDNSKTKPNYWFKSHHGESHSNNDSRVKQSSMLEKKIKQSEQLPNNAINVKDLEDRMRKTGYHKYFPHQNNSDNSTNNQYQYNQNKQTHHHVQHYSNHQQQSPIKASVNAFTQSAYKQMLAQANTIVKQAQDPEIFRRFLEQINSASQLAALSQLSKPLLQPILTNNNNEGSQKRIPSTRELEFHTRNIVQNALFRKHLQEQHKRRLQELQQITLQSNINPNAPEFTPTSVLRKMSAEKENVITSSTTHESSGHIFFEENKNFFMNKSKQYSAKNFQQQHWQQHQHSTLPKEKGYSNEFSSILDNFNIMTSNNSTTIPRISEKHIKWNHDNMNYTPICKPSTGRPILKGSNVTTKPSFTQYSSTLKQQQQDQYERQHFGFDGFLKEKYGQNNGIHNRNYRESSSISLPIGQNLNEQKPTQQNEVLYESKQMNAEIIRLFGSKTEEPLNILNQNNENKNNDTSNKNYNVNDNVTITKFKKENNNENISFPSAPNSSD